MTEPRRQQKKGVRYHLTFFRHRWFLTWLFMMVISGLMLLVLATTGNKAIMPAALFYGSAAAPLAFAMATHVRTGIGDSVPAGTLLATFLFGGGLAIVLAAFFDAEFVGDRGLHMWPVGFVEELAKFLPVLAIALTGRYLDKRSGLALGFATAMGFAILESMSYGLQSDLQAGLAASEGVLVFRGITTPFSHLAWTGLLCVIAFGVWERRGKVVITPTVIGAYLLVAVLHSANDALPDLSGAYGIGMMGAFLAVMIGSYILFRLSTKSLTFQPGETVRTAGTTPTSAVMLPEQRPGTATDTTTDTTTDQPTPQT